MTRKAIFQVKWYQIFTISYPSTKFLKMRMRILKTFKTVQKISKVKDLFFEKIDTLLAGLSRTNIYKNSRKVKVNITTRCNRNV